MCYVCLFFYISCVIDLLVDVVSVSSFVLVWNGCVICLVVFSILVFGVLVVMMKLLLIDR